MGNRVTFSITRIWLILSGLKGVWLCFLQFREASGLVWSLGLFCFIHNQQNFIRKESLRKSAFHWYISIYCKFRHRKIFREHLPQSSELGVWLENILCAFLLATQWHRVAEDFQGAVTLYYSTGSGSSSFVQLCPTLQLRPGLMTRPDCSFHIG